MIPATYLAFAVAMAIFMTVYRFLYICRGQDEAKAPKLLLCHDQGLDDDMDSRSLLTVASKREGLIGKTL